MPKSPPSDAQLRAKKRGRSAFKSLDSKRGSSRERGYGSNWAKISLNYRRDNPLCEECKRNGIIKATDMVDHIIPLKKGGTNDPDNLQSLCNPCHAKKTHNEDALPKSNITIIAGPPGAGKTTLARKHMRHGDLIVDIDEIYAAITGLPKYDKPSEIFQYALSARDGIYYRLEHPHARRKNVRHAWIIAGLPKLEERIALVKRFNAELIILEKSVNDCIWQVQQGDRPERAKDVKKYATKWWKDYEREPV